MTRFNGSWIVGSRAAAGRRFGSHELAMGWPIFTLALAMPMVRMKRPLLPGEDMLDLGADR